MIYLINEDTKEILPFSSEGAVGASYLKEPWRLAENEELLDYKLELAQAGKIAALKFSLEAFNDAGYTYIFDIVCDEYNSETVYNKYDLVAFGGKNYISLVDDPEDTPEFSTTAWKEFFPKFKTDQATTLDLQCQEFVSADNANKYKFYSAGTAGSIRKCVDFGDAERWAKFLLYFMTERDRIMKKYHVFRQQIISCSTVEEVEKLEFNFSI